MSHICEKLTFKPISIAIYLNSLTLHLIVRKVSFIRTRAIRVFCFSLSVFKPILKHAFVDITCQRSESALAFHFAHAEATFVDVTIGKLEATDAVEIRSDNR